MGQDLKRYGVRPAVTHLDSEVLVPSTGCTRPSREPSRELSRELSGQGLPRRVAVLSVHTSPLEQPGGGDAGGLNVYVVETSKRLAARGVAVEIFTRAARSDLPPSVELAPGVLVRHVSAGPFGGVPTRALPSQLCAFAAGLLRAEAGHDAGWYDLVHSHYWLSGHVGRLAGDRWGVPLVHSAHTLAKVKNARRSADEPLEPAVRMVGEDQIVAEADRLVAATAVERHELIDLYAADPARVSIVAPGVDLDRFRPGDRAAARAGLGLPADAVVLAFVGRVQQHKGPDVLIRAAAELRRRDPRLADRLVVAVVGGVSGRGYGDRELPVLAAELGLGDAVRFLPPVAREGLPDVYRAADVLVMPSRSESFGLAALEAQACGTPVVAAPVGGLPVAVAHERSGLLTAGGTPEQIAAPVHRILTAPDLAARLSRGGPVHAANFTWDRTVDGLLAAYRESLLHRARARVGLAR